MPGTACVGTIECFDTHYLFFSHTPIRFQRIFTKFTNPRISVPCGVTLFPHFYRDSAFSFVRLSCYYYTTLQAAGHD